MLQNCIPGIEMYLAWDSTSREGQLNSANKLMQDVTKFDEICLGPD